MKTRTFRSPDGLDWTIEVTNPGASNAIVVFKHPAGPTARLDRYAHYLARGPEARNVTSRLNPAQVLEALQDRDLQRLFRTSFPATTARSYNKAV